MVKVNDPHFVNPSKHPFYGFWDDYQDLKIIYDSLEDFQKNGPGCSTFCISPQGFWKNDYGGTFQKNFEIYLSTDHGQRSSFLKAVEHLAASADARRTSTQDTLATAKDTGTSQKSLSRRPIHTKGRRLYKRKPYLRRRYGDSRKKRRREDHSRVHWKGGYTKTKRSQEIHGKKAKFHVKDYVFSAAVDPDGHIVRQDAARRLQTLSDVQREVAFRQFLKSVYDLYFRKTLAAESDWRHGDYIIWPMDNAQTRLCGGNKYECVGIEFGCEMNAVCAPGTAADDELHGSVCFDLSLPS